MKSLKKLKEEKAEREKLKAEKEAIKKEKERLKKEQKRKERKRKLKKKQNQRCYARRRAKQLQERNQKGDEHAYFTILITKNKKRISRVGASWWKTDAYKIYNNAIEQNQSEVKFPINYLTTDTNDFNKTKWEIIMIKKVKPDENTIAQFKNENGKYVNNIISDKNEHIIVDKHEWLVEESFNVYGYHPIRDRKNFDFILNDIVLNDISSKDDIRSIITYNNKLIIKYIDDFDFVICKNKEEANRLYSTIEKHIPKEYKKMVLLLGEVPQNSSTKWLNMLVEKTGWTRETCLRPYV